MPNKDPDQAEYFDYDGSPEWHQQEFFSPGQYTRGGATYTVSSGFPSKGGGGVAYGARRTPDAAEIRVIVREELSAMYQMIMDRIEEIEGLG